MKILKVLFLIVLVLVVAFVAIGFFLPKECTVSKSIVINAPPAAIHEHVENLRTWPEWTAWNKENYPDMAYTYSGAEKGLNASYAWDGKQGKGQLTLTKSDPQTGVEYDFSFDEGKPMQGGLAYAPEGDGTKVTWNFSGELEGIVMKYIMLLAKGSLEKDFMTGLEGLKARVEGSGAKAPTAG